MCILRLFLGFLLLVIKLHFVLNVHGTGLLNGRGDDLLPNYELLFQLGFVQISDFDRDKNFLWTLPGGVSLFHKMIFTRHLARFSCVILLLCGDILPNPGPPRYLGGVCNHAVRNNDKALLCDTCSKWFHIECTRVSPDDYDHYCTLSEFDWSCLLCLFDVLPPNNVCNLNTGSGLATPHFDDKLLLPEGLFGGSFTASLCIVHHNVQGLLSKFIEFTQWLHSCYNLNIIVCCSETWLRGGSIPAIPGFVSYCSLLLGRTTGTRPLPGSCLFVSNTLSPSHSALCETVEQSTTCLNVTCCFVSIQHSQTAVLSAYRSPSTRCTAAMTELQSILMQLSPHVKYVIVAGDFNIDLKSNPPISKENLLDDFCLTQHISEPSRVSRGSATLIDHISGSDQLPIIHSYQAVGLSDYYAGCGFSGSYMSSGS